LSITHPPFPVEVAEIELLDEWPTSITKTVSPGSPVTGGTLRRRSRFQRMELQYSCLTASAASVTGDGKESGRPKDTGNLAVACSGRVATVMGNPRRVCLSEDPALRHSGSSLTKKQKLPCRSSCSPFTSCSV
jgi:hypothetical protein